jgi:hypothetical protein
MDSDRDGVEEGALETLIGRIPACCPTTTPSMRCCCGRTDCVYLKHNWVALDDLEKEVRTAAQLGQVCIPRTSSANTFSFGWNKEQRPRV